MKFKKREQEKKFFTLVISKVRCAHPRDGKRDTVEREFVYTSVYNPSNRSSRTRDRRRGRRCLPWGSGDVMGGL